MENTILKSGKIYKIIRNGLFCTTNKTKRHQGENFTIGDIFLFLKFEDEKTLKMIFKGKVVYFPFGFPDRFNVWFREITNKNNLNETY